MAGQLLLVLHDLSIELVGQHVDCRVHVGLDGFRVKVLAAQVHGGLDLLLQLVHRQHDVHVDHVIEVARHALQLVAHVAAERGRDVDMVAGELQVHRALLRDDVAGNGRAATPRSPRVGRAACGAGQHQSALRRLTGGICSASRYFAMVRRATRIPCSPSRSAIRLSVSGAFGSSAPISCLMSARMAVADAAPPLSVATWLPKKYFSSNVPRGVSMYFCVVTREIVDSCSDSMSAISRSTMGRIATSPCSKKRRCRSTMAFATRRIVSNRCCTFRISHFASCNCAASCWFELSRLRVRMSA